MHVTVYFTAHYHEEDLFSLIPSAVIEKNKTKYSMDPKIYYL